MSLVLKQGVELAGLSPQICMAAFIVHLLALGHSNDGKVVITSGSDSHHSSKSKHYRGDALDFRTRNLEGNLEALREEISTALGRDFDVLLERDHLHVEYDPRRPRALSE